MLQMKYSFKDIYLPIKANLIGKLIDNSYSENNELKQFIRVTYLPESKIDKRRISVIFFFNGRSRWYMYGKTIKEIKALVNDLNDFTYDPYLFLSI